MSKYQRVCRELVKGGLSPERAVLLVASTYKLSMRTCELLIYSLKPRG